MQDQASKQLGETVRAVATVSTQGTGKKRMLTAGIGGAIGAAAANAMSGRGATTLADYKGYMVLGLGEQNLGVFKQKSGLLRASCGDLLETIPVDQISSFDVSGGAFTSPLTIGLADGTQLQFEVARAHKGKLQKLKAELGK